MRGFLYVNILDMLQLTKGKTDDKIVMTLAEKLTLSENYEYFITFVHATTKQSVSITRTPEEDGSTYPERYNEFDVNTATTFATGAPGEWLYTAWERDTVTDELGAVLEVGKMQLLKAEAFTYNKYNPQTSYAAYNG